MLNPSEKVCEGGAVRHNKTDPVNDDPSFGLRASSRDNLRALLCEGPDAMGVDVSSEQAADDPDMDHGYPIYARLAFPAFKLPHMDRYTPHGR